MLTSAGDYVATVRVSDWHLSPYGDVLWAAEFIEGSLETCK